MALILQNGQYIKVSGIENNQIVLFRYKNAEMRQREKTNTLDEFERVLNEYEHFPYELRNIYPVDSTKNMIDNEKVMAYLYLHTLDKYKDAQDDAPVNEQSQEIIQDAVTPDVPVIPEEEITIDENNINDNPIIDVQ